MRRYSVRSTGITIGSLFSGIGGLELGLERAGLGPVLFQVEQDPACRAVLARHWPDVPRFDDVCDVEVVTPKASSRSKPKRKNPLPHVDLLCGGFPCQGNSSAGKGLGLKDPRSALWFEFRRIAKALAPPLVVVENVASGARRWLPHVRKDLHVLGYRTRAFQISASDVGAPHLRRRVFVVAADPERVQLWDESGWRGRSGREGTSKLGDNGTQEPLANADGFARDVRAVPRPSVSVSSDGRWWASEPAVGRVAHGIPGRVDRLRMLGNAVVPHCAEVIGQVIRSMTVLDRRLGAA